MFFNLNLVISFTNFTYYQLYDNRCFIAYFASSLTLMFRNYCFSISFTNIIIFNIMKSRKNLIAAIIAVLLFTPLACGPVVRVKITGTKDGVTVNTTQSAHDSTGLNITVNPNINL